MSQSPTNKLTNHELTSQYQPVMGLEVHVELKTNSKMFCGCSADYFGKEPNSHTCPVCLGLPGALPVPNKKAIEFCVMIGMALGCKIPEFSKFDRKNYFYPDLPKGYQISQYDRPFCIEGSLTLSNGKKIGIRRVHMEEDTAKLTHATVDGENVSLIDFNRSGVPLVEIVTEPDFETAEEVVECLKKLQQVVRYLGVSNADMEKGNMRLEPNISLRRVKSQESRVKKNEELPPYKVEVKNINSFRFVAKAIDFEVKRQKEILEKGETPKQETRGWNEAKNATVSQRSKEEAQDYRYFPEPDIPPVLWNKEELEKLRESLPELPWERERRYMEEYKLPFNSAATIAGSVSMSSIYDKAVRFGQSQGISPVNIANYIINQKIDLIDNSAEQIIDDMKAKSSGVISDESSIMDAVKQVLDENPDMVESYKKGKTAVIQAMIGLVMKKTSGKADATKTKEILEKLLKEV